MSGTAAGTPPSSPPPAAAGPTSAAAEPTRACTNCGTLLLGPHCYRCGQPLEGLVRHFGSIIGDFFDSVLDLDSRTVRTMGPLLLRPGFLTREYFAGRRVPYVTPVRLVVFLTVIAFFVSNLALDIDAIEGDDVVVTVGEVGAQGQNADDQKRSADTRDGKSVRDYDAERALTVTEAERARDNALMELATARKETSGVPGLGAGLAVAEKEIRAKSKRRIDWLRARDAAINAGTPVPREPKHRNGVVNFGGWDPHATPVAITALPDFANAALTRWGTKAYDNGERIRDNPRLLFEQFFSVAPQTLFVLLPLFALLLKIAYFFKRRLYMEHLIVALHSHAFIALWMILAIGNYALSQAVSSPGLKSALELFAGLLWIWLPLYLLIMQKRVYGQGWIMTLLKFGAIGVAYVFLVAIGATVALMLSLVIM